jgi:hypothetical protein
MKMCSRKDCDHRGQKQPFENFYKKSSSKDGLDSECKSCKKRRENFYYKNSSVAKKEFFKNIFG